MMNLKVRKIISITVIFIGFISALLMNGVMPPIVFYWLGFILYFGLQPMSTTTSVWQKWGRRGLFLNIVLTAILLLLLQIIKMHPLSGSEYYFYGLRGLNTLSKPISHVVDLFSPNERVIMPDGNVQIKIGYLKSSITSLLDVMTFIAGGVLVGKYFASKGRIRSDISS